MAVPERKRTSIFSRQLVVGLVVLGVFVLAQIALFSWLIFRSLSEREVERVLGEARREGKALVTRIQTGREGEGAEREDLLLIIARDKDLQDYLGDQVRTSELIARVEIKDSRGVTIFRAAGEPAAGNPELQGSTGLTLPPLETGGTDDASVVSERIGELGTLQVFPSETAMRERAEALRQALVSQTAWIAVVSFLVLVLAYILISLLIARGRRLEEQAREADRLAYVGTLAAGLAHEIRSPLNSLNLNLQMLEEDFGPPARSSSDVRLFQITRQEIRRLERLVSDFLLYAKPRRPQRVTVPAVELLERVRDVLAGEVRARGARCRVEDKSAGALVQVDLEQMTQLVLNLANNALAATEESGRAPEIVLRAGQRPGKVVLEVEDNGVGIPEADQEKIFEVFYSTKKGGTGLGLAVVQRIAQTHDATLDLVSQPGEGTTVSVTLPQSPTTTAA
jgi:signal transduction histidine kinase